MSNDSKLGLVLGLALVLLIGLVFFKKEAGAEVSPAAIRVPNVPTAEMPGGS